MKYTIAREIGIKQITKANVVVILKDFFVDESRKKTIQISFDLDIIYSI